LGGALGLVLAARCCLNRHWRPRAIGVQTFGSPSVLAHRDGGGGDNVLQVLGLLSSAVRSFVLEHDPVPKAFITADPTYLML
ncbi:lipase_3 domain-containing protein, partial [Haematococcus lacustris]